MEEVDVELKTIGEDKAKWLEFGHRKFVKGYVHTAQRQRAVLGTNSINIAYELRRVLRQADSQRRY